MHLPVVGLTAALCSAPSREPVAAILLAIRELTNPLGPKRRGIGFAAKIDEKP
jgi:hypothetical protein